MPVAFLHIPVRLKIELDQHTLVGIRTTFELLVALEDFLEFHADDSGDDVIHGISYHANSLMKSLNRIPPETR